MVVAASWTIGAYACLIKMNIRVYEILLANRQNKHGFRFANQYTFVGLMCGD